MQKQGDYEQEKRNQKPKLPKFQGAEKAMQGHVYNIERTGKPSDFIPTTEFSRDLVRRTFQIQSWQFFLAEFKETPLETSARSASSTTDADKFEWQLKIKDHCRDKTDLERLKFTLWALLWGQYLDTVKKKLKAMLKFIEKEKIKDYALIFNIRKACSRIDDTKHLFVTMHEARRNFLTRRQSDDQTMSDFANEL